MNSDNLENLKHRAQSWLNPPAPGLRKSPVLGFVCGFLLGPVGAGLYLRSVVDFGLSVVAGVLMVWTLGMPEAIAGAIAGAGWAVGRILHDNRRYGTPPSAPTPQSTPPPLRPHTLASPAPVALTL